MSNVIQFRKLPEVSYGIEIDQEYESRYHISLRRYQERADKIMIIIFCSDFEQLPALRESALQEARKGYQAICRGSNPYGWNINNIMPDNKTRAGCHHHPAPYTNQYQTVVSAQPNMIITLSDYTNNQEGDEYGKTCSRSQKAQRWNTGEALHDQRKKILGLW